MSVCLSFHFLSHSSPDTADARAGSEAAAQQPADRSSGTGAQQGRGAGSGGNAQAAVGDEEAQEIPELFAPGRLLYIRKPSGASASLREALGRLS